MFPVRYGLNFYILFRRNLVFKGLSRVKTIQLKKNKREIEEQLVYHTCNSAYAYLHYNKC
jgi:hypothetical protein